MSNPTSNFNWSMPTASDLVTDLPADFEVFGQAVDTTLADLKGGTTGQILSKASNTDMDFTWVAQDDSNAIQNAIVDAKGDLIAATASDTPARLAVGTNGQVLTANSSAATGLAWSTISSGAVVQIVGATTSTTVSTTSASYVDSGLTVTITPTSASNKVMLFVSSAFDFERAASSYAAAIRLYRSTTGLTGDVINDQVNQGSGTETGGASQFNLIYLDSPATTSATTYKIQMYGSGGTRVRSQSNSTIGSIIAMEVTP